MGPHSARLAVTQFNFQKCGRAVALPLRYAADTQPRKGFEGRRGAAGFLEETEKVTCIIKKRKRSNVGERVRGEQTEKIVATFHVKLPAKWFE